jgi:hypothetical protein
VVRPGRAILRDYEAVLVRDAHTTQDLSQWGAPTPDKVIDHTNLYWAGHTAPWREAGTRRTESISVD